MVIPAITGRTSPLAGTALGTATGAGAFADSRRHCSTHAGQCSRRRPGPLAPPRSLSRFIPAHAPPLRTGSLRRRKTGSSWSCSRGRQADTLVASWHKDALVDLAPYPYETGSGRACGRRRCRTRSTMGAAPSAARGASSLRRRPGRLISRRRGRRVAPASGVSAGASPESAAGAEESSGRPGAPGPATPAKARIWPSCSGVHSCPAPPESAWIASWAAWSSAPAPSPPSSSTAFLSAASAACASSCSDTLECRSHPRGP